MFILSVGGKYCLKIGLLLMVLSVSNKYFNLSKDILNYKA